MATHVIKLNFGCALLVNLARLVSLIVDYNQTVLESTCS